MQGAMGGSGETVLIMAAVIPTRNDGACKESSDSRHITTLELPGLVNELDVGYRRKESVMTSRAFV